jgi:hypothetical protein
MSNIYPKCVYTIVQSDRLHEIFNEKNGKGQITEKKLWTGARALLDDARENGDKFFVLFTPAEATQEIVYFAEVENIVTFKNDVSTMCYFKNLTPTAEPRPLKEELIIASSGQPIRPGHIRPYVLCRTPNFVEPEDDEDEMNSN